VLKFASAGIAAILLTAGGAVACTPPTPVTASCAGHKATIVVGARSPASVNGTSGNDVIAVTGGLHTVNGGAGNDVICADSLGSTLIGGAGNDTLIGGKGNDTLKGQTGRDTLNGGGGVNRCDLDPTDASTHDCKFDFAPPTLKSFQVLTPRIDMTAGQTELRVEAQATDDISGVNEITLQFCDPNGVQDPIMPKDLVLTSGTDMSGVWDGTIDLSSYLPAGLYSVCFVNLSDKATNVVYLSKNKWSSTLPSGAYAFDVINDKNDTTAPVVSDVSVSASSVDVTNGPVTVTTDFTVMEDGSGVDLVMFGLDEDAQIAAIDGQTQNAEPALISPSPTGADGSGRYRAIVTLPAGSAPGSWHVNIMARDRLFNATSVQAPVRVVDTNPITTLPQVVSLARTAGADVHTQTYTVHLTSARDTVNNVDLGVHSADMQQWANGNFTLISGTPLDGVWTATVQLPPNAEPGTWSVSSMSIYDALGHIIPVLNPVVDGGDITVS
jgi:hypothetical protein